MKPHRLVDKLESRGEVNSNAFQIYSSFRETVHPKLLRTVSQLIQLSFSIGVKQSLPLEAREVIKKET